MTIRQKVNDMNYQLFKKYVEMNFADFISAQHKGARVEIRAVHKVNQTLDGLTLVTDGNCCPTVYVQDMYAEYMHGTDLSRLLRKYAMRMEEMINDVAAPSSADVAALLSGKEDSIVYQVINYELNKELLKTIPHRRFLNLAVVYRMVVSESLDGIQSVIVTNELAEKWELSESRLYELAEKNTPERYPTRVSNIADMFGGIMAPGPVEMYILTNKQGINGASAILNTDVLGKLADMVGCNLYILPSSIHEIICVPAKSNVYAWDLEEMVRQVNTDEVSLADFLSDDVYLYRASDRCVVNAVQRISKDRCILLELPKKGELA